jgi:hypothetical protein
MYEEGEDPHARTAPDGSAGVEFWAVQLEEPPIEMIRTR